jgi:membrane associated rhomboid family serine protease
MNIYSDIISALKNAKNQTSRLIWISILLFTLHFLVVICLSFFQNSSIYISNFNSNYFASSDLITFLHHFWTALYFPFTSNSILNFIFEMISLYWFGNIITDFIGARKTFTIFVFGAYFSLIYFFSIQAIFSLFTDQQFSKSTLFGVSPGIYALMFAVVALLPEYEIPIFRIFIKLKYIALALLIFSFNSKTAGILNLGGAIFGYLHIKMLRTGWDITFFFDYFLIKFFRKERLKSPFITVSKSYAGDIKPNEKFEINENYLEENEIDHILDKISNSGYENLSKEEKQKLYNYSQQKD